MAYSGVSSAFLAALQGSMQYVARADVWSEGKLVKQSLDITAGSLSVSAGQAVRSQVSVTVADPDGLIRPTGDDSTLSPFGPELALYAGIRLGSQVEWCPLGRFPITQVDVDQRWRAYQRKGESSPTLVPSGTVDVTAADRALWISEARIDPPTQPTGSGTVLSEIGRLLSGVAPWQAPSSGVTDVSVPASLTYSDDRMAAVQALADVVSADPVVTYDGTVTLLPRAWGSPVWTIQGGETGVLATWKRSKQRAGTYNGYIQQGGDPTTGTPRIGRAYVTSGPLRWRYGLQLPYLATGSGLLTTQSAVDAAAAAGLAKMIGTRTETVQVECSPNPAVTVGDVVTLQAPRGSLPVLITAQTLPLTPGRMQLTCSADPVLLGQVA